MGENLADEKRKAIEIDRAVRKARQRERAKQGCLGCLGIVALALALTFALAQCPSSEKQSNTSPLAPVRGVFIARPLQVDAARGTVTLDGWSDKRGADEQVSFTLEINSGRMVQCQYWSQTALNHLTNQHPPRDVCGWRNPKDRPDGGADVEFAIVARSLKQGRPRRVSGTLVLSPTLAHALSRMLQEL